MGFYTKFLYLLNFLIPLMALILICTLAHIDDSPISRTPKLRSEMTEQEKKIDDAAKTETLAALTKTDAAISIGVETNYKSVTLDQRAYTLNNGNLFVSMPAPPKLPDSVVSPDQQPITAMLLCPDSTNSGSSDFSTGNFDNCLELQAKESVSILYDIDSSKTYNNPKHLVELARYNGNVFEDASKVLKIDFGGSDLNFYLVSLSVSTGRRRRSPRDTNAVILSDSAETQKNEPFISQPNYADLTGGVITDAAFAVKVDPKVVDKNLNSVQLTAFILEANKSFGEHVEIEPISEEFIIDEPGSADQEEPGSADYEEPGSADLV